MHLRYGFNRTKFVENNKESYNTSGVRGHTTNNQGQHSRKTI